VRAYTLSRTGAGNSNVGLFSLNTPNFQITLAAEVTGLVDYTIQYTFDPRFDSQLSELSALNAISDAVWYPHSDLTAQTANKAATLISPATAVRIVQNSGAGTTRLHVLQSGRVMKQ
jgi:hypothetical protein